VWHFYGAGWQQIEQAEAYKGRIIVSGVVPTAGEIAKGLAAVSIDAAPGQLVYDDKNNQLGCIQPDKRTIGGCRADEKEQRPKQQIGLGV
jgi:hypothetical protein